VTVRRASTPAQAWAELAAGNARFVKGTLSHPNQGAARRHSLARGQRPLAVFFGCADSRVAAEIIFDMGLGDLFVIRTAGHVVDTGVLGSLEFGVGVLDIPLIVILGHDSCGAVAATIEAVDNGVLPSGYIRDIVERVTPSVLTAHRAGLTSADEIESEHVRHTIRLLRERSNLIADRIATGQLAIVGAAYHLDEGRARVVDAVGDVGEPVETADTAGAADTTGAAGTTDAAGGADAAEASEGGGQDGGRSS
jgi:carbonic anhydrase